MRSNDLNLHSRRYFLQRTGVGLGAAAAALAGLLSDDGYAQDRAAIPHFAAKAKRVFFGVDLPDSVRRGRQFHMSMSNPPRK